MKANRILALVAISMFSLSLQAQDHSHETGTARDFRPAAENGISGLDIQRREDSGMAMPSMQGMYGQYPMSREASGTSWQPDSTPGMGIHASYGSWNFMWHGFVNAVYDHQGGSRGDDQAFSQSMLMGMGLRPLGGGTLGLRTMFSLDALMGRRGYPLLFQTGESSDGSTPLIDRQHPHDLFMELAATYSYPLSRHSSAYVYVGLPGEPALGPPTYMHRFSGMDNPEAPLNHHWLDSTHITFGVVTAGYTWRKWKIEGSAFNGREPDQSRFNIETRKLDSYSTRLSWNPTPDWALQASYGRMDSPELLEPGVAIRRTTASAIHQYRFGSSRMQTTLAWGRNDKQPGRATDGWLLESAVRLGEAYTLFGRAERVEKDELFEEEDPLHGRAFTVGKLSLGGVYDFYRHRRSKFGIGALVSKYDVPSELKSIYGSDPTSYMVFVRGKLE